MKAFLLLSVLIAAALALPANRKAIKLDPIFHPNDRIINGEDAEEGEFPYQISYQWEIVGVSVPMCGGAIIDEQWVLISARCILMFPSTDFKVVAGITLLDEQTEERQEINIVSTFTHPNFSSDGPKNDVGLLKLEKPLVFGNLVKPIELPASDADFLVSGDAVLTGWGSTFSEDVEYKPNNLQTASFPILPYQECIDALHAVVPDIENPVDEKLNICTGPLTGAISACDLDAGGPLAQNNTIVGILSWAYGPCGAAGFPLVYTNVASFLDFINDTMSNN